MSIHYISAEVKKGKDRNVLSPLIFIVSIFVSIFKTLPDSYIVLTLALLTLCGQLVVEDTHVYLLFQLSDYVFLRV